MKEYVNVIIKTGNTKVTGEITNDNGVFNQDIRRVQPYLYY